jgi:hypothetical protein
MNEAALRAITQALWSPTHEDSNMEMANITDAIFAVAHALDHVAEAITNADDFTLHQGGTWLVDR